MINSRIYMVLAVLALLSGVLTVGFSRSRVDAQPRTPLSDRCRECVDLLDPTTCLDDGHCKKSETMHYTHYISFEERQAIALEDIARSLKRIEKLLPAD